MQWQSPREHPHDSGTIDSPQNNESPRSSLEIFPAETDTLYWMNISWAQKRRWWKQWIMWKAVSLRTNAGSVLKGEKEIKVFLLPDKKKNRLTMRVHWCGEEQTLPIHSLWEARAGVCGIDSMGRMSKKVHEFSTFRLCDAAADVCHECHETCWWCWIT